MKFRTTCVIYIGLLLLASGCKESRVGNAIDIEQEHYSVQEAWDYHIKVVVRDESNRTSLEADSEKDFQRSVRHLISLTNIFGYYSIDYLHYGAINPDITVEETIDLWNTWFDENHDTLRVNVINGQPMLFKTQSNPKPTQF